MNDKGSTGLTMSLEVVKMTVRDMAAVVAVVEVEAMVAVTTAEVDMTTVAMTVVVTMIAVTIAVTTVVTTVAETAIKAQLHYFLAVTCYVSVITIGDLELVPRMLLEHEGPSSPNSVVVW